MSTNLESASSIVHALVEDFGLHRAGYIATGYSETDVRQDYLNKFFTALGWDVAHERQKNPFQQEVKVERNVADGPAKRRADYAFFTAPNFRDVRLFAEAKKPFTELGTPDNCFQAIRYAWNSQTPLVVLTNFEELYLVDARYKPDIATATERIIRRYNYKQYAVPEKFAELYFLLGRDAVAEGSLEKFAAELPKKRGRAVQRGLFKGGYQSIDEAFLAELDEHREVLARSFKAQNHWLDGHALTEITQRVLDRLVFIRFLEDKLIEPEYLVSHFGDRGSVWSDFIAASRRLDAIYNGIVFKKHPLVDSDKLVVDDDVFGDICEQLSHINSAYDFNAIPIHILGSIYERFLGNVIVTTEKRARLEEKPEVRKAGGVYYTPEYIVRYITEQTIGPKVEGKSPTQIGEMKFLDLACGSGSFLLGVFDYLLQYHAEWYNANRDKCKPGDCYEHPDGTLHLTLSKRRDILVRTIFGVDIDAQAVEVAQLSLYLKLLEEESTATARAYQLEFHATLLPSLGNNIVCGNSLIEMDIFDEELLPDVETEERLNPMTLRDRFPSIFPDQNAASHKKAKSAAAQPQKVGFDAIVGNPPYVRPHNISPIEKKYFWKHYKTFTHKADLYCCFIERGTSLLKPDGRFGYIVSQGWMRLNSFEALREHMLANYRIDQLVELPYRVFADAAVETGIFVLERSPTAKRSRNDILIRRGAMEDSGPTFRDISRIPQSVFRETFQHIFDTSITPESEAVKRKMAVGPTIGSMYQIVFGLKTGDDAKFIHRDGGVHAEDKPLLRGGDVQRYSCAHSGEFVWYVPAKMRRHRPTARPGEPARFEQPKVLVKDTSNDFACAYDDKNFYVKDVLVVIARPDVQGYDLRFLAGVINSRALRFYYLTTFQTVHVQNEELASLPLPKLDLTVEADRVRHDRVVALVDQVTQAKERLRHAMTHRDQEYLNGKCREIEERIDRIVDDCFELDSEDIATIESMTLES